MIDKTHQINIQVDLRVPKGDLQRAIQAAIYLVSGSLNSAAHVEESHLKLPEVGMETNFDPSLIWSAGEIRSEIKEWILRNGFRDSVEILSDFLEKIHSICSVWSTIQRQNCGEVLNGADYQQMMEGEPKKFHRQGFPDKLNHLRNEHEIAVDPKLLENALSINTARNCLVHRKGVVGAKDATDGKLVVSWRRLKLVVVDEDGEHELVIGQVQEKDGMLAVKLVEEKKVFQIGEAISFTAQEFQNIAWSLVIFGSAMTETLIQWGRENGFLPPVPQTPN